MKESLGNLYASVPIFYDIIFGKILASGRQRAIEALDIKPDEKILEIGIGTGLSLPLYPKDFTLVGIDICPDMLQEAENRKRALQLSNVHLHLMDAANLVFEDDTFDKVIAAHIVTTVPDPTALVKEIKRVCKDGGKIVFLNHFHNGNGTLSMKHRLLSLLCKHLGWTTNLRLEELLLSTGLHLEYSERVNIFRFCQVVRCTNNGHATGE